MRSELKQIIENKLEKYQTKQINITGKDYQLSIFLEEEDLNLFEGFLFVEIDEKSELLNVIKYRAPVSGYTPRIGLFLYKDQLIIKDYRRPDKFLRKTLRKINQTFLKKLKKVLSNPTRKNLEKIFDRTDIIEEFYILYKNCRNYLLKNLKGISDEEKREEFIDTFMIRLLTLWYLQEGGFFNKDKEYFITKFGELKQKKLIGGFNSYYQFLSCFFEKITGHLNQQYYEDNDVGKVVVVGPAIALNGREDIKAISLPNKCFYKENITDTLISTPADKLSIEIPILNLFESRDWTEGNIDEYVLGAIYEKLITEDLRKKTGAYYTPEEITTYICKNTIERYLVNKVNNKLKENFETVDQIIEKSNSNLLFYLFEELKAIKILDPAVGSAHFLESAIEFLLSVYYKIWIKAKELELKKGFEIIAADENGVIKNIKLLGISDEEYFKLYVKFFIILSKNIYGVDINKNALNVGKARLFLTLAKHFDVDKNYFIRFPNVHFNLREGNSLIGYIDLGESQVTQQSTLDLFLQKKETIYVTNHIKILSGLESYLKETALLLEINGDIITEIDELNEILSKNKIDTDDFQKVLTIKEKLIRILIVSLNSQHAKPLNDLLNQITDLFNRKLNEKFSEDYKISEDDLNESKTFHWIFEFPEVFLEKKGFDVIIGNPPYGETLTQSEKSLLKDKLTTLDGPDGSTNSASVFIERSYWLLSETKYLGLIIPSAISRGKHFEKIRRFMLNETFLLELYDMFSPFIGVNLEMMIAIFQKRILEEYQISTKSNKIEGLWTVSKSFCLENEYIPLYFDADLYDALYNNSQFCLISAHQGKPRRADYIEILDNLDESETKALGIRCISSKVIDPYYLKLDLDTERVVPEDFPYIRDELEKDYLITPYFFGTKLDSLNKDVFEVAIKPKGYITDGNGILLISEEDYQKFFLVMLNSELVNYVMKRFVLNFSIRDITIRRYELSKLPLRLPNNKEPFEILCEYLLFLNENEERRESEAEIIEFIEDRIVNPLVYELYLKKELRTNYYSNVKGFLKSIKTNSSENVKLRLIKEVVKQIKSDEQSKNYLETINKHEWVTLIKTPLINS